MIRDMILILSLLCSNLNFLFLMNNLNFLLQPKLPHKSEKQDSGGQGMDRKTSSKDSADRLSYSGYDVPYDFDRKEKFKMVLGKPRKDGQDSPSKTAPQIEVSVDLNAAAAILQAARRGIRNPDLGILSKPPINGIGQGPGSDCGQVSSFGTSSQPQTSIQKSNQSCEVSVPVANAIAKTAALAAANEADSSEACLNREQKLKAERLKRAKMFAAMIRSGVAPLQSESRRSLSVEPPNSAVSGSGVEVANFASKEREGSSVPVGADATEKEEKPDKVNIGDEYNERVAKRRYRVRSRTNEKEEDDDDDDGNDDDIDEAKGIDEVEKEDKDHKSSRKKKRSRSSHHSRERHKHRKRHSSKERDSRHRHRHHRSHRRRKHESSSDDEDQLSRHQGKHNTSSDEDDDLSSRKHKNSSQQEHQSSPRRKKHRSSYDAKHRSSRHQKRHRGSDDDGNVDEQDHEDRTVKHKKSHSRKELDLEEGELSAKSDHSKAREGSNGSREASADISKSYTERRESSQPSEVNNVSDDLRAKVRAMLLANL